MLRARAWASSSLIVLGACAGPVTPGDCASVLSPGSNDSMALQQALASLSEGQTLCLSAGRFVLDAPIELEGRSALAIRGVHVEPDEDAEDPLAEAGTILDFAELEGAEAVITLSEVTAITLEDLTVESPPASGIVVSSSEDVTLRAITIVQGDPDRRRTADGVRVVGSSRVRVDSAQILGGSGAGVTLSRCRECVVERSVVLDHLVGALITESELCEVRESELEVNGIGIVVADLPEGEETARAISVRNNLVIDSGLFEQAAPPESPWPYLAQGTGVLVLAADDVELAGNAIEGNRAAGVLVLSWSTLVETAGAPAAPPGYDGDATLVHAHDDTFLENGFDPSGAALAGVLSRTSLDALADVVWDGAGDPSTLCARPSPDAASTFLDLDANEGFVTVSSELAAHDCEHPGHGLVLP